MPGESAGGHLWDIGGDESARNCAPKIMEESARAARFLRRRRPRFAEFLNALAVAPVKNCLAELRGSVE
jgi:hypothetical protein